jgi:uncharacterized protein (TIGR03382 family)
MKRALTFCLLCGLAATPSFGSAQPAPVAHGTDHKITDEPGKLHAEPGTMAMASIGLMALGATLRRRRGR